MKLFVWDFHGTLEKGTELAVAEISNLVLEQLGYPQRFSLDDCRRLYGEKWFKYFEHLLPQEPQEKHLELQATAFDISLQRPEIIAGHIRPNDYAHEILTAIAQKHRQILISNTAPDSLKRFLEYVGMQRYFPEDSAFAVDGHDQRTKRTKATVLEDFLVGREFESIISIGDSPADVALATGRGVSYLYSHPGKPFRACQPNYRIRTLREVLREV